MEMRRKSNRGYRVFNRVSTLLVGLFALLCLLPFLLLLIGSFTDNDVVVRNGYSFFPQKWSVDSYVYLFRNPQGLINAYKGDDHHHAGDHGLRSVSDGHDRLRPIPAGLPQPQRVLLHVLLHAAVWRRSASRGTWSSPSTWECGTPCGR